MKSKLLLFDIDGTLLTSHAGKTALSLALKDRFGFDNDLKHIELAGRTDAGIARQIFAAHGIEPTPENLSKFYDGYLHHLSRLLPEHPGRVFAGVVELLEKLKQHPEFVVALLTGNLSRGAEIKLTHYGIWHYFEFGAFADDHHERNQLGPFAMERAEKKHGVAFAPKNIIILGDTPHDIACARAIHAKALAVCTGIHTREELAACHPDVLLDDLTDTDAVIEILRMA
ncbi:MAG: haloacid dehalogenase-like hydrolase [Chthoniobacteraceae bacterium]